MKFTKDDARKELSAQMTAKGEKLNLSERSLNEQLDALIPLVANEEMELTDFVSKVLPIFKTADANVRNDVSAGINDYKKQNPQQPGGQKKVEPTKTDNPLEQRLADLEAKLAKAESAAKVSSIKTDIAAKLKEKGVKNDEWTKSLLNEVNISEDIDVDAKVDTLLGIYNQMMAQANPNVTPASAGAGNPNKEIEDAIKEASKIVSSQRLDTKE
jgi:hypothetical protein